MKHIQRCDIINANEVHGKRVIRLTVRGRHGYVETCLNDILRRKFDINTVDTLINVSSLEDVTPANNTNCMPGYFGVKVVFNDGQTIVGDNYVGVIPN